MIHDALRCTPITSTVSHLFEGSRININVFATLFFMQHAPHIIYCNKKSQQSSYESVSGGYHCMAKPHAIVRGAKSSAGGSQNIPLPDVKITSCNIQ